MFIEFCQFRDYGLITRQDNKSRLRGKGELRKKLKVTVDLASASGKEKVEKAGGSVEL